MFVEIAAAQGFILSYLYNKMPRRRVDEFGNELVKFLRIKFKDHWYPEEPEKGSGFRCIKVGQSSDQVDQVLQKAAWESGVFITDVVQHLPAELTVWIDPGEVSYKIGDKGHVNILFRGVSGECEDFDSQRDPRAYTMPYGHPYGPMGSPDSLPTSPISPNGFPFGRTLDGTFAPKPSPQWFTAGDFAQTKFGSTKLKSSTSKKTNRMSPTQFSNYIKQRSQQQQNEMMMMPLQSPRDISPGGAGAYFGDTFNERPFYMNNGNYGPGFQYQPNRWEQPMAALTLDDDPAQRAPLQMPTTAPPMGQQNVANVRENPANYLSGGGFNYVENTNQNGQSLPHHLLMAN